MELKERFENMLGCSLYDLFPEISIDSLKQVNEDREQLLSLLKCDVIDTQKSLVKSK